MSTSPELSEESPKPIEVINDFLSTNSLLSRSLVVAYSSPNIQTISETERLMQAAKEAIAPFHSTKFFRDSDSDAETAIDSLMVAITELAEMSHIINPNAPKNVTFSPGFKEVHLAELQDEDLAQEAATRLCNIYGEWVGNANDALLTSDQVVEFMLDTQAKTERKKQFVLFGGTALAAFAGTLLANKLNRK